MITLHHLENSRSQRILWLLEELGVDYEIEFYKRDPQTQLAPPELARVHPLGKSPVITDGDTTVAESGAIIEYLAENYGDGTLLPEAGTAERLAFTYWMHYAEGSFMPLMIISLILARIDSASMPFFIKPIAHGITAKVRSSYLDANVERNLRFMESSLEASDWFCGNDFTAADIQMSFALEAAAVRTDLEAHYPRLSDCLQRMHARPAYKAALDRGGPYALMSGAD